MRNVTRADIKYLWPSVFEVRDRDGIIDVGASMRQRVLIDGATPKAPIPADEVIDQFFTEITKSMEEFNDKRRRAGNALITTDDVQIIEVYLIYEDDTNRTFRDPDEIITYEEERDHEHVHWAASQDDFDRVAPRTGMYIHTGGPVGIDESRGLYQQMPTSFTASSDRAKQMIANGWKPLSERERDKQEQERADQVEEMMRQVSAERDKQELAKMRVMEEYIRKQVVNSDAYKDLDHDRIPSESRESRQLREEYMSKVMGSGGGWVSGLVTDQGKQPTAMQLEIMQMKNITPPA